MLLYETTEEDFCQKKSRLNASTEDIGKNNKGFSGFFLNTVWFFDSDHTIRRNFHIT